MAFDATGSDAELVCISDGAKALEYLLALSEALGSPSAPLPDLILLDINMPRLDGREFLRQAREIESLATIPVIALTTSSNIRDIQDMYRLGANSYVTKPQSIQDFTDVIAVLSNYWLKIASLPGDSA